MTQKPTRAKAKTVVFADHEVITPPETLQETAIVMARPETALKLEEEAIQAANKSLEELSHHFPEWIMSEIAFLETVSEQYYATRDAEALATFYRKAHDIRGHAATLGFPGASAIAEGLCLIIEKIVPLEGTTFELVQAHVNALRTGINNQLTGKDKGLSLKELTNELAHARQAKFGTRLDPV